MSVIAVLTADRVADDDTDVARVLRKTPGAGGYVSTGLAGYQHNGSVYCPTCGASETVVCSKTGESYTLARFPVGATTTDGFPVGIVTGTSEWDFPGAICDECGDLLDTNVIVYDGGGGAHPHPVVGVEGDDDADPITAFVLHELDDHVEVIYAPVSDDCAVESGEISTVPRERVVEGLEE
jgi:hypothetical protein